MTQITDMTIRPLDEADLPGWLALVQADEILQLGAARATEEALLAMLRRGRVKLWALCLADEGLVGCGLLYPQIRERCSLDVTIHPAHRRRGLGRHLLEHLACEAQALGADCLAADLPVENEGGQVFLERAGFEHVSHVWALNAAAETDFPALDWPQGFRARNFAEVNDLTVFTQAINRGYAHLWGHDENTAGGVTTADAARYLSRFDPRAVWIVFAPDGSPIGSCRAEVGQQQDVLDGPGIAPEHEGLHLQVPLALHACAWLRAQGRRAIRLESWGDAEETIKLYEGVGFRVVEKYRAYKRAVG